MVRKAIKKLIDYFWKIEPNEVIDSELIPPVPILWDRPGIKFGSPYDNWTKLVVSVMQDVTNSLGLPTERFKVLLKPNLSTEHFEEERKKVHLEGRLEIFCGHGKDDALLGPFIEGTETEHIIENNIKHSDLYTKEMIPNHNSAMFAYCCSAASFLGQCYVYKKGNVFLGFNQPFLIDIEDKVFVERCSQILKASLMHMLTSDSFDYKQKDNMAELYEEIIHYYQFGNGSEDLNRTKYVVLFFTQYESLVFMENKRTI